MMSRLRFHDLFTSIKGNFVLLVRWNTIHMMSWKLLIANILKITELPKLVILVFENSMDNQVKTK